MVAPVIPRPSLDISPPPRPRVVLQPQRWRLLRPHNPRLWGLGLGSLALGLVNGGLVISAGVGLVAYQQLLQLSPRQRKGLMQRLQQGLPLPATPQQQALVLALVAGASTYTFSALWHSTHSLLMALLLTGQGALALFAVGALLRSSRSPDRSSDLWDANPLAQVDHNLSLLSHPDPLKRLVAVRRLGRLVEQGVSEGEYGPGVSVRSHLSDCFQLRLAQETDEIVRSALEAGLSWLRQPAALAPSTAEPADLWLATPPDEADLAEAHPSDMPSTAPELATQPLPTSTPAPPPPAAKQRRSAVEYVEYLDV